MHGIYQCKHGVVIQRCRCSKDTVYLQPCPKDYEGNVIYTDCRAEVDDKSILKEIT